MSKVTKRVSHGDYYLDLIVEEPSELVEDEDSPILIESAKPILAEERLKTQVSSDTAYLSIPPSTNKNSGVRIKVPVEIQEKIIPPTPKRFLISINYHYPFVYFPPSLEEELGEIQEFFSVSTRGSGSVVHGDRMVSVLTYRVNFDIEKTRTFSRIIVGILDRYGVEIITDEIIRIK